MALDAPGLHSGLSVLASGTLAMTSGANILYRCLKTAALCWGAFIAYRPVTNLTSLGTGHFRRHRPVKISGPDHFPVAVSVQTALACRERNPSQTTNGRNQKKKRN